MWGSRGRFIKYGSAGLFVLAAGVAAVAVAAADPTPGRDVADQQREARAAGEGAPPEASANIPDPERHAYRGPTATAGALLEQAAAFGPEGYEPVHAAEYAFESGSSWITLLEATDGTSAKFAVYNAPKPLDFATWREDSIVDGREVSRYRSVTGVGVLVMLDDGRQAEVGYSEPELPAGWTLDDMESAALVIADFGERALPVGPRG